MSKRPILGTSATSRDQRLRAALRENLARRKAQGRARAAEAEAEGDANVKPRADAAKGAQEAEQGEGADPNGPANQET